MIDAEMPSVTKCSVESCPKLGIIQDADGVLWCADHIWKSERPSIQTIPGEMLTMKNAWGRDSVDINLRLDLMERGTRWEHYAELRELFACGIEIIKHMHLKSSGDDIKRLKLEGAVELLDARLNLLSDFTYNTTFGSKLRGVVDGEINSIRSQDENRRSEESI